MQADNINSYLSLSGLTFLISSVWTGMSLICILAVYSIILMLSGFFPILDGIAYLFFYISIFICSSVLLVMVVSIIRRKEVLPFFPTRKLWMGYIIVVCEILAAKLKIDSAKVVRSFIKLHNEFIINELKSGSRKPVKVMILLPHCLQLHSCKVKITNDVSNCKKCGKCIIGELIELTDSFKIDLYVSTGGTMARKVIKDRRPDFVLAVACERDLFSGIKDTLALPVVGVLNDRPNGPCFNTTVSIGEIRRILHELLM